MILEGIVTTLDLSGRLNVAPMGPRVEPDMGQFVLRPFRTSTTFGNLKATGAGVLHVVDDVLLLARTAIGLPVDPPTRQASRVRGQILLECCRFYEFVVAGIEDRDERTTIQARTVATGRLRDHFGFNRAKHAVIEAAILATRIDLLPIAEILDEFRRLAAPVQKTGGPAELEAFGLLDQYVHQAAESRSRDVSGVRT